MKLKEMEEQAKAGDPQAQSALGYAYLKGDGKKNQKMLGFFATVIQDEIEVQLDKREKRDPDEAFKWFSKAAEQGEELALKAMGKFYHFGFQVEQDYKKSIDFFRRAGELGEDGLTEVYSEMIVKNGGLDGYQELLEKESDGVLIDLACRLMQGEHVIEGIDQYYERSNKADYELERSEDWNSAAEVLEIAAERGTVEAMYLLGQCLYQDEGAYDAEAAFQWFSKGAELGDDNCRYMMAKCYESGEGVEEDAEKAAAIYQELEEKGFDFDD